mgnify:FL=1|jgi:hypothetical protein|tara:strand:+ start:2118 stop:2531 length:414 start_codon:yes stop_codon:yes gene_type:complete
MPKRFPRKVRPREKNVPKGYDSKWEYLLHQGVLKSWDHHTDKIPYVVQHNYEPDFIKDKVLIEAKGRFWDHAEYSKYIWIRKSLPDTMELVFLFQKPYSPMPGAKKRKDGTKRTHAEWAEANNFKWYTEETLPEEFK